MYSCSPWNLRWLQMALSLVLVLLKRLGMLLEYLLLKRCCVDTGVFAEMDVATVAMISGFAFDLILLMSILEGSSAKTFDVLQMEIS